MPVLIFLAIFAIVLVALALGNMFRGNDRQDLRRPLPTPPQPPQPPQPSPPPRKVTLKQEEVSTSDPANSISPPTDRIPTPTPDPSPTPVPAPPLPSPFIDNSTPSVPRQPLPLNFTDDLPASGQNFPLPTPTPAEIPLPRPELESPAQPARFRPVPEIPTPEPEPELPVQPAQFQPEPELPVQPAQFQPEPELPVQPAQFQPEPPVQPAQFQPEPDRVAAVPSFPQSDFSDLASDMGVDYRKLRDLLAAQNYKEADGETRHLMVGIIRAMERDYDSTQTFEQFPCTDLRTIDRLWVQYSEGRFGLSVQKPIYDEAGQSYEALGDRVGWRQDGEWLNYHELTFDGKAPRGHLPRVLWVKVFGYCGWEPSVLAQKLVSCDF